jgi:hypothetical protein
MKSKKEQSEEWKIKEELYLKNLYEYDLINKEMTEFGFNNEIAFNYLQDPNFNYFCSR